MNVDKDILSTNGVGGRKAEFNARELFFRYLHYLPWLLLSLIIFLIAAYIKLRYTTPTYNVYGKMLIKKQSGNDSKDRFEGLFMGGSSLNLADEIEQIKSSSLGLRVVKSGNLQITYEEIGKIRSTLIHPLESPFIMDVLEPLGSEVFSIKLIPTNQTQFALADSTKKYYYGQTIEMNNAKFKIFRTAKNFGSTPDLGYIITWHPAINVAKNVTSSLSIGQISDFSNVLLLSYEIENPKVGLDIINAFMKAYSEYNLEEKKSTAFNTLQFIDEQLDTFRLELGGVERSLQQYREKNQIIDVQQQSSIYLGNVNSVQQQLINIAVQTKLVDYLIGYLSEDKNEYRTVPATLGISEPTLLQSIGEFNRLQLQRETYLKTTPEANPIILDLQTAISKLRSDMIENLKSVRQSYVVTVEDLQKQSRSSAGEINAIPGKQKQLLDITRQQQILQELYSFLLKTKLETSIASASSISSSRVLEPAYYSTVPVKPNNKATYLFAAVLGLALPLAVIAIREIMNNRISSRKDVENATEAPILGEISHSDEKNSLVVTKNNRKVIAEQFRIIRTALQFILNKFEKPVIMLTSSFSGEGKSFICTNLGAVMALAGKKTVILEFDLRKPKIIASLGLSARTGLTNYIVGKELLDDIIVPVKEVENLHVISCGPIPPNPAELLLDEKVKELFRQLRQRFDVVIVDSAPVGLVSDALILSEYVDATLYVIRHNYTLKKQVGLIDEYYRNKKLPKVSLLLNDIKTAGKYNGYDSYGYGYGYAYGSGYFDEDGVKKSKKGGRLKRWLSSIKE
ncbi:MAG: polysaccharide biosynthesis tyrosine autokinase [Chitinophagaceae bacterium]